MDFNKGDLTDQQLLSFYDYLLRPRLIEEKMLILLRQGKISKWFSGIGQEAISVGSALALDQDEYILTMHRNLGVFTTRNINYEKLFAQFQGKKSGFTKGRDRSFHFGSKEHHIVGMISHLGAQTGVADGIALASKLKGEAKVTLVFSGDGGTSEGDFHEAVNVASVWQLPVIFLIENNGYGLSTPSHEQFTIESFVHKGPGYGIETESIDGNNLLEVYHSIRKIAKEVRKNPRPFLVEANTFRMRGHEEASGTKYVPIELMNYWAGKDPIKNFEAFLEDEKILNDENKRQIKGNIKANINRAVDGAFNETDLIANQDEEERDLFYPYHPKNYDLDFENTTKKRFVDAISDGLKESLEHFPELIIMGQDIAEYGGVFKVTEGFHEIFGKSRIRNTPICESAVIGAALGLSIKGIKSIVEMQFADFVTCGFNQVANNLAKTHYRWGQNADVVIRMPTGAGVGAGPFHSQSNEAWFFHIPGLKIVYPSNPLDAKGLLNASIEDPNPYLFFEHKALYRSISAEIPNHYYQLEVGKAEIKQSGEDATVITYGMGVYWALEIVNEINANVEIIDLRTLMPYDKSTITQSINKTNKVIILHEDTLTGGIGAEIGSWIAENCFTQLDAPVFRVGSLDTPVPFSSGLEKNFLPKNRFKMKLQELLAF